MKTLHSSQPDPGSEYTDSFNCVDVVLAGPGDTTVRPCRPSLLPRMMAEREKVARWKSALKRQPFEPNDFDILMEDCEPPK